jgi:hypothetical protein
MRSLACRLLLVAALAESLSAATSPDLTVAQLLASPRKFDGQRVSVTGYYYGDTETTCLYATPDGAKRGIANSIWVEFRGTPDVSAIAGRHARLVGTFHYDPTARPERMRGYGSMGLWSVALLDTTSFQPLR